MTATSQNIFMRRHSLGTMEYKLYSENCYDDPIAQILTNRGIDTEILEDWEAANNPNEKNAWKDLDDIIPTVAVIEDSIAQGWDMDVVVDSDADGFTSAAIFINYIRKAFPDYGLDKIHYYLHNGKEHGLSDMMDCLTSPLVIVPDAGSNDYEFHDILLSRGQVTVILDHHEAPYVSNSDGTFVVNNQLSDRYENKNFSGAGIVYRFCQAMDAENGFDFADNFLDLVALGNLSDMMDYRSLETRAIINKGLQQITNPFFHAMVEKNSYSIEKMGGVNYNSIAWYVTPFINAAVRSGTQEEKELIFKSFLIPEAFEKIESGKRGHKGEMVPRVEEAVRIITNIKARQTKLQDSAMALLENKIIQDDLLDNAIIVCLCEPGEVEKNLAGLAANKIQAKYQRPCLVLTKSKQKDDKEYFWRGSARNYSKCEIEDMRQTCEDTGVIEYAQGHAGAFGFSVADSKLQDFIDKTNEVYKDISLEPVYWVDYIWDYREDFGEIVAAITDMKPFWGQNIPESLVVVKDIPLAGQNIQLLSPDKHPTIKISLNNGVDLMKFKSSQEEYDSFSEPNKILTIVGTCNLNEWNGRVTPQIIIEDYILDEKWVF